MPKIGYAQIDIHKSFQIYAFTMNKRKMLSFSGLFITAIVFGFTNIAIRYVSSQNYFATIFLVLLLSTIMLLPVLRIGNVFREVKSLKKPELIVSLSFFGAISWFLVYFAIMNTSIANAVFGFMTTPVFVIALGPFLLKEHINKPMMVGLILALIGILLVFDPRNIIQFIVPLGIFSGVLAGLASAMVQIIGRKLKDQYHPYSLTFLQSFFGMCVLLIASLLTGFSMPSVNSFAIILFLGAASGIGWILVYYALRSMLAQSSSIILMLEPFTSIVAAFLILGEIPSILSGIGAIFLIAADIIIIIKQP